MSRPSEQEPWTFLRMPAGWDMKFDQSLKKYFYLNHNTKSTTWEDPRKAIWLKMEHTKNSPVPPTHTKPSWQKEAENKYGLTVTTTSAAASTDDHHSDEYSFLNAPTTKEQNEQRMKHLKTLFPSAPNSVIIEALKNCSNREFPAIVELQTKGYKKVHHSVEDDIVHHLMREYPTAEEGIVRDVLHNVHSNELRAKIQLESLGYLHHNIKHNDLSTHGVKTDHVRHIGSSSHHSRSSAVSESNSTGVAPFKKSSSPAIKNTAHLEAIHKTKKDKLIADFPALPDNVVQMMLESSNWDETRARSLLEFMHQNGERKPGSIFESTSLEQSSLDKPSSSYSESQPIDIDDLLTKSCDNQTELGSHSSTQSNDSTNIDSSAHQATSSMSITENTLTNNETNECYSAKKTSAIGPNKSLAKGPDKSLLIGEYLRATGPDKSLVSGPDLSNCCGPAGFTSVKRGH